MNRAAEAVFSGPDFDVQAIKRLLPHRQPFLMLDRLNEIRPGESAVGWKAVTGNEPHFAGHFPEYAVMPGVLIVEAMAQAAGALVVHSLGLAGQGRLVYFMTIDKARFRKPVHPGVVLRIPVKVQRHRGPVWRFEGKAFVGDDLCAEAEFSAMLAEQTLGQQNATTPDDAG
jgi:3-hydroxyacyl-[acyl-carrier-protein] dehydratase